MALFNKKKQEEVMDDVEADDDEDVEDLDADVDDDEDFVASRMRRGRPKKKINMREVPSPPKELVKKRGNPELNEAMLKEAVNSLRSDTDVHTYLAAIRGKDKYEALQSIVKALGDDED